GGTKLLKIQAWLEAVNDDPAKEPYAVLGSLLEQLMDREVFPTHADFDFQRRLTADREAVKRALAKHALSYQSGGKIFGAALTAASRSLDDLIRERNLAELQKEFDRARVNVELDPPAAITAACAILESTFKVIIADEGLAMPSDLSVLPLWRAVRAHLALDPAKVADPHLKEILGGLAATVHGIAGLRSNAGSAHGQ